MTDNEIIKALECCPKARCRGDCEKFGCPASKREGCSFYLRTDDDYEGVIFVELIKDAHDLINRQKAEIERLQEHNNILICRVDDLVYECDCAKQEAINEFAERLKKKIGIGTTWDWVFEDIEETVKEMTEEQK